MLTPSERIENYKAYLKAFNAHSLEGIKAHLSPLCTCVLPDGTVQTYDEMIPTYPAHWERSPNPIELRSIKAIESSEGQGGVWTLLRDADGGMDVEVEYFWEEDSGSMIRHVIKSVTMFKEESQK